MEYTHYPAETMGELRPKRQKMKPENRNADKDKNERKHWFSIHKVERIYFLKE